MLRRVLLAIALIALTACPAKTPPRRPTPLSAEAYGAYLAGRLALLEGAYDRAIVELTRAAEAAPDEAMIVVALIDAQAKSGARATALATLAEAEAKWPRQPAVWLIAGQVHRDAGEHDEARAAYEHAIHLGRANEDAWLGLAASWLALARPARAEHAYRELLKVVPDSIEGHFRLASALIDRGADADAEVELRKVIELEPDHIDGRLALARALRQRGDLADAILETRQAFDRTGGDLEIAEELFWLLCESGDRAAALDLLGLLDDPAAEPSTRLGLSRLYGGLGALDDAVRLADAARADDASSTAAALAAAQARADRKTGTDLDDALALALEIPIASDDAPIARALAAELLVEAGDPTQALAVIAEARRDRPESADLLAAEAETRRTSGDVAGGRDLLERAVEAKPGSVARRFVLASFERAAGDPARAAKIAERIIEAEPDHVAALNLCGYALAEANVELDRAEGYLRKARDLAPGDPSILDSWGWLRFRQGKLDDAEQALVLATRLAPHEPEIQAHLDEVRAARRR